MCIEKRDVLKKWAVCTIIIIDFKPTRLVLDSVYYTAAYQGILCYLFVLT